MAFRSDITLGVVGIDCVAAHAHGIWRFFALEQLVLGHDEITNHPPCLTDVDLMRPMAIVRKLILRQAPDLELPLDVFRHPGIRAVKPEPTFLVGFMFFENLTAMFIARFWIVVVETNVVRAHRAVIVRVRLVIGNGVELVEGFPPPRLVDPSKQFVLARVVLIRPSNTLRPKTHMLSFSH